MPATVTVVPDRGRLILLKDWLSMSYEGGGRASIEERALYRAYDPDEGGGRMGRSARRNRRPQAFWRFRASGRLLGQRRRLAAELVSGPVSTFSRG